MKVSESLPKLWSSKYVVLGKVKKKIACWQINLSHLMCSTNSILDSCFCYFQLFPLWGMNILKRERKKEKKKRNNHDRIVHSAAAFLSLSSICLRVSLTFSLFYAFFLALKVKKDMTEWHPRSRLYLAGIVSIALFGPVFISCPLNLLDE